MNFAKKMDKNRGCHKDHINSKASFIFKKNPVSYNKHSNLVGLGLELSMALALTARRVLHDEHNHKHSQDAQHGCSPKAPLPRPECAGRVTADHVAEAAAHRDGKVEDGQRLAPGVGHEHVRDDGGRNGGVAGLTDADHGARAEERPEVGVGPTFVLKQKKV